MGLRAKTFLGILPILPMAAKLSFLSLAGLLRSFLTHPQWEKISININMGFWAQDFCLPVSGVEGVCVYV